MITVTYSDGFEALYKTIAEAEDEAAEAVVGCDFAATIVDVKDENGKRLHCTWSLSIDRFEDL